MANRSVPDGLSGNDVTGGVTGVPSTARATLVDEFRDGLRAAPAGLLRTLATTDEEMATLERRQAGAPVEDASTATGAAILAGRERREVDEIESALTRLAAGTHDLCEPCGRAVGLARLRALPATRHCLDCQLRADTR